MKKDIVIVSLFIIVFFGSMYLASPLMFEVSISFLGLAILTMFAMNSMLNIMEYFKNKKGE